jgi:hypothetical protein
MELLVAEIYRSNFAHAEVVHVGRTGDGGADVVFVDGQSERWLIQVKRRERAKSAEGVETLRNLLGTSILQDSRFGVVVSTADHFTHQARIAARQAHERGFIVELVDRHCLNRLLDPLMPADTWRGAITQRFPAYAAQLFPEPDPHQLNLFGEVQIGWPTAVSAVSEIVKVSEDAGLLRPWPRD